MNVFELGPLRAQLDMHWEMPLTNCQFSFFHFSWKNSRKLYYILKYAEIASLLRKSSFFASSSTLTHRVLHIRITYAKKDNAISHVTASYATFPVDRLFVYLVETDRNRY